MWGRRVLHGGCFLIMFSNCWYRQPKQTAIISFVQCKMLIIDVSCFMWWESATMICVATLQNCMDCVEGETGSCSATCVQCAADGTEGVSIKIEEAIDIEDEIPEAISFPEIKTEPEVKLWCCLWGGGSSCFLGYLLPQKRNSQITLNDILLFVIYFLNFGIHSWREETFWNS